MATKLTTEEFISRAKLIHGDKYDYSDIKYVNKHTKVYIVCPEHGGFWQSPNNHLSGNGCPECWKIRNLTSKLGDTETFTKKAKNIHGDKYDYSKVDYSHSLSKVCIICPIHGEFWQTPNMHLHGQGCPICNESTLEKDVRKELTNNNMQYVQQYKCSWLGRQSLDFFLPQYNIGIECQGIEHFKPSEYFGGEKGYEVITSNDLRKSELCSNNGIKLLYYTSDKLMKISPIGSIYDNRIFSNTSELLKNVK